MKKIRLSTTFCKVRFSTPLVTPSGIVVAPKEIIKLAKLKGIGGVTTKSYSILSREGHPLPHIASYKVGFINAVGLKNPGIKKAKKEIVHLKKVIKKPIIASIFTAQLSEFAFLAREIAKTKPDFIELNLSCPHVDDEFGRPLACDPMLTAMAILEVKKVVKNIPIIAKLTPNTPELKRVAFEVEKAGADAICAINTVGPGLLIDIKNKRPILGHGIGGVSGPAIKPIALRCVNDIYKTVKIPIIGVGGISSGKDAIEMIMAGASLVGIGSAIYKQGYEVFNKIIKEIEMISKKEKINSLKKIRGII
ncbi:dihydroorotate dehydrogenase [Candidatus Microgenomates bacterium]|nr:dihydroorotate dehydrogenase [Candidatus Microgenomates bacterium]